MQQMQQMQLQLTQQTRDSVKWQTPMRWNFYFADHFFLPAHSSMPFSDVCCACDACAMLSDIDVIQSEFVPTSLSRAGLCGLPSGARHAKWERLGWQSSSVDMSTDDRAMRSERCNKSCVALLTPPLRLSDHCGSSSGSDSRTPLTYTTATAP